MSIMKENIPISQEVDIAARSKIPEGGTMMDDVETVTSGKKRSSILDIPSDTTITESNDVIDDNQKNGSASELNHEESHPDEIMESIDQSTDENLNTETLTAPSKEESRTPSSNPSPLDENALTDPEESKVPLENRAEDGSIPATTTTTTIDIQRPVKRARTAYFLFLEDHRNETQKQHPGEGVGSIARILGQRWSELTDEEKQPYHVKAALERERVAAETELWKQARADQNLPIETAKDSKTTESASNNGGSFTLPVGRVRKICRLDPEVRGISKEALVIITKATEMFTIQLGQECVKTAHIQNRRTLLPQDVVDVCQIRECFQFLKDDINDLHRQQKVTAEAKTSHPATKGKLNRGTTSVPSTKPLTDYFKPVV